MSDEPKADGEKPKKPRAPKQPFAELPPALDIRKIGRPSKYDSSFCDLVRDLGAEGKSKAQIAACIGVNRDTLNEWTKQHDDFSVAVKDAQELALAWWENAGQMNMTRMGFNATAFIFQMKNRFREDYRDVVANELTGRDGGPIETQDVSARELIASRLAGLASRGAANSNLAGAERAAS